MVTEDFEFWMRQCIALAEVALQRGDPPVGAIIICTNKIIGMGIEAGKSTGDITNHAEIEAIRDAVKNGHGGLLPQSKMVTTHEPCIMCSYVIRHHKIPHLIFGTAVPHVGGATSALAVLRTGEVPKWGSAPLLTEGVCAVQCAALTTQYKQSNHGK